MAPSRDAFEVWLEDPVTRWVFRALEASIAEQKRAWLATSWDNGVASPAVLAELRVRADALSGVLSGAYDQWCEWNGDSPNEQS